MSCDDDASFRNRINQTERMGGSAESSTYWSWILNEHFLSWAAAGSKPNLMKLWTRSRLLEVSCCRTQPWPLTHMVLTWLRLLTFALLYILWFAKYKIQQMMENLKKVKMFSFYKKNLPQKQINYKFKWAAFSCCVEWEDFYSQRFNKKSGAAL